MRAFAFNILAAIAWLTAGLLGPAAAGEYSYKNRPELVFPRGNSETVRISPYPMGKRASAVWVSDSCWRGCTGTCNGHMQACMSAYDADACRPHLDACDRACQRTCRTRGGPLLGFIDF
jgi:hypothetical protein